ncbi:MAG: transporter substrate-binding domain-containing protein [Marinobacter sp.]|uniref:substrate-binding periplasmic protein n=1 Tax=Marinobacter sp. TaxID=50741 RepID=UPI00299E0777|nr:transporter substrate-binding domain-containing protein [Marinobacter sp.]MDX1756815.1 transporter substrate-binding domain-containing protein [Marinobacter sp.]
MNSLRCLSILVLLLFSGSALAELVLNRAPERTHDIVIDSGYLNVGVYDNFPPYSFMQDGEPAGVDVDIGRHIARELGVEFRVHWIVPDETLEDDLRNNVWKGHYLAKTRVADVMMRVPYDKTYAYMRDSTGEVINDQVVLFGPYQQEQWQIAFDPEALDGVPTMAVFQYHPIGVEIDTLPDTYLTSAFRGRLRNQAHHYRSVADAFDAMVAGDVSAVMGMRGEIDYLLSRNAEHGFQPASNGFPGITKQVWDVGMAVKHTHRQLGHAIEAIVDRLVRNGEMAEIFARYGLRYEMPGFYQAILSAANEE